MPSDPPPIQAVQAVLAVLGCGLVDPDTPIATADDLGLTRGDGCFEGCRVRIGADGRGAVDKLDLHLARMARSATALELPFDPDAWRAVIDTAVAAWTQPGEAALKLVLTRGRPAGPPTGWAWLTPMTPETVRQRRDGLKVISLARGFGPDAFAAAPWLLGGVKTLSYAVNMAAQRAATAAGADDVIFTAADGSVLESPTGTVVWALGGTLHTTPTGATGILEGTTQRLLFTRAAGAGLRTASTLGTLDDLHAADAVWLISSVRGPVEVVELDGKARTRDPQLDATVRRLVDF